MASIEKIERVLEGVTYNRVTLGLAYFRAVKTGMLKAITLYRSTTGGISGVWYLNVRQNGASLFSGVGRPSFSLGVGMATKTGLSVSVTAGDVFTLDIEQTGGGAITGNLVWVLEFENDDAVVSGPGTAVTDNAVVLFDGTTGELLQDSATVLSTDGTLAANSDIKIPTEKAVKTYVDANIGGGTGVVETIVAGTGIDVDATDPANPIVSAEAATEAIGAAVSDEAIGAAVSDEATALTTGTAKITFRIPYAFTLSDVRASVTTAPTGASIIVDINEGGSTILSTKLTIDATEKTSTTAATPAVISDASLADDAEITVDIDQVGSTVAGAGLKIWLIGVKA